MDFEIIGDIYNIKTIAIRGSIRVLPRLKKVYGNGQWRKKKGIATVAWNDKSQSEAEIHWYEAHGIGKKEIKIKRLLGDIK